jgi:hypothetical protein
MCTFDLVTSMVVMGNACGILAGKCEKYRPLGMLRRGWKGTFKVDQGRKVGTGLFLIGMLNDDISSLECCKFGEQHVSRLKIFQARFYKLQLSSNHYVKVAQVGGCSYRLLFEG